MWLELFGNFPKKNVKMSDVKLNCRPTKPMEKKLVSLAKKYHSIHEEDKCYYPSMTYVEGDLDEISYAGDEVRNDEIVKPPS